MSLGASVVTCPVAAEHADEPKARAERHLVPAARETRGCRGFLLLDMGGEKRLALILFDSIADVGPVQHALTPVGQERTYGLMTGLAIGAAGIILVVGGVFADLQRRLTPAPRAELQRLRRRLLSGTCSPPPCGLL